MKRAYRRFAAGDAFGRLTILRLDGRFALCLCACGTEKRIEKSGLRRGAVVSCGCYRIEQVKRAITTHGKSETGTYSSWSAMIDRCRNPRNTHYADYGGRGISVCPRWLDFKNFLADMGERPDGHTIERGRVNGNYEPGNCTWATQKNQCQNMRTSRRWTIAGVTYNSKADAALALGVGKTTISNWCCGYRDASGSAYPPRAGCRSELLVS